MVCNAHSKQKQLKSNNILKRMRSSHQIEKHTLQSYVVMLYSFIVFLSGYHICACCPSPDVFKYSFRLLSGVFGSSVSQPCPQSSPLYCLETLSVDTIHKHLKTLGLIRQMSEFASLLPHETKPRY